MCQYKRDDNTCVFDGITSIICHAENTKDCVFYQIQESKDAAI